MRRSRRLVWLLFALCGGALVAAMVWVSSELLELEARETEARHRADFQTRLRLALWRMDNKFSLMLAREAARPHTDYEAFPDIGRRVYAKRDLQQIADDELLAPSPLLSAHPEFVQLYFQVSGRGRFASPQVPEGIFRELAVPRLLAPAALAHNEKLLARVQKLVELPALTRQVEQAEEIARKWQSDTPGKNRAKIAQSAKLPPRTETVTPGPLEPLWQGGELLFVRRVRFGDEQRFQGFLADWPRLRATLLSEIGDLFSDATLSPLVAEQSDRQLFTLPVKLATPAFGPAPWRWTASHTVLAFTWAAVLLALGVVGITLGRSVAFGERQRRFASLVTHELRSPLTTFRLYADLLAEGLVREAGKRDEYHRTLQRESQQMARMVENVIALSRVEEGRAKLRCEKVLLGNLLDQVAGDLEACAGNAGLELAIEDNGLREVALETDPAAVGQILLNLVENACKYGRSERRPAVIVSASRRGATLQLRVRDFGPGVAQETARRMFRPFERGRRTDAIRGLGLGLTLSRGLARDLGGDLAPDPPRDAGARFTLTLPLA